MGTQRSTKSTPTVIYARDGTPDFDNPDWAPLLALVGKNLTAWFMWMGSWVLEDGRRLHNYKHRDNRRNAHITDDGRCYGYEWDGSVETVGRDYGYFEITRHAMVCALFDGWQQHDEDEQRWVDRRVEAARLLAFEDERFSVDPEELRRQREYEQAQRDEDVAAA